MVRKGDLYPDVIQRCHKRPLAGVDPIIEGASMSTPAGLTGWRGRQLQAPDSDTPQRRQYAAHGCRGHTVLFATQGLPGRSRSHDIQATG